MTQKGDSTVEVKARKDRGVVVVVVLVDVVLPVPVPVVFVPLAESTIFTGLMLLTLAVPVSVPPLLLVSILKDEDIMITTTTATMDFECSLRPLLFCKFASYGHHGPCSIRPITWSSRPGNFVR